VPLKVTDGEILEAQSVLARKTGVFVEPAAAASLAGLVRMAGQGQVDRDDTVVLLLTGTGLKDTASILDRAHLAEPIPPRLDEVERRLAENPLDAGSRSKAGDGW
ncbi:MAG: pyridoxal-phosphate dependent enzyme, partial [Vicinamibacteria bacterium]